MLALRFSLMTGGLGMVLAAVGILGYDLCRQLRRRKAMPNVGGALSSTPESCWLTSLALGFLAWGPILLAFSVVLRMFV